MTTIYNTVYKITNKKNNKIYVGVHKTEDLDDGYPGSGYAIMAARKKYGDENFVKEILSLHNTYPAALAEEARIVDEAFVKRKDTYNLQTGGRQGIPSDESRAKNSAAHVGKTASVATKAKMSAVRRRRPGRPHSEEAKAKISVLKRSNTNWVGKTHSVESRAKMSASRKGKTHSVESRAKMSASRKGKTFSPEHRANLSASAKGKPCSAETRTKISVTKKGRILLKKTCPHCGTLMDPGNYAKFHGDKCKQSP